MTTSNDIAKLLLELKAVALNTDIPFRYTSGLLSPIYCDNRLLISNPKKRNAVIDAFLQEVDGTADVIAGVATAGIPHAAWIADRLNKPMVYVRSSAKGHGKQNQIEGTLEKNSNVVVIEDLISTGKSSLEAALVLRDAGAQVKSCLAIFTYQMPTATQGFQDANIQLRTLSNFSDLVTVAVKEGYIDENQVEVLLNWQKDPKNWKG